MSTRLLLVHVTTRLFKLIHPGWISTAEKMDQANRTVAGTAHRYGSACFPMLTPFQLQISIQNKMTKTQGGQIQAVNTCMAWRTTAQHNDTVNKEWDHASAPICSSIHTLWPHEHTLHPSGKAACSPVTLRICLFTLFALNITSWTLGSPSLWWPHPLQQLLSCNEKPPKLFREELSLVEPLCSGKTPCVKFLKLHNSRLK